MVKYVTTTLAGAIKIICSVIIRNKVYNSAAMCSEAARGNNWRGVPLSKIYGCQSPWDTPEFPSVSPGENHAVLYHIPNSGIFVGDRPPKPQVGEDIWDGNHVRLPCSSQSQYPVVDSNGQTHLEKRWDLIEVELWKPIRNSQELANTILTYNTMFKDVWRFRSLHKLFNEYLEEEESQYFFDVTLPEIAKLALALPKLVQAPIPLLKQHVNGSVSLSQQQISSLLANAFFCTYPRRNSTKRNSEFYNYSSINFSRFYDMTPTDEIMEKLKSICHYFRRVCTKAPVGVATFTRRAVVPPLKVPRWPMSTTQIASLPLHVDPDNAIEEADGLVQVDFANKFLGGGVLGVGCVQEEIRFVICPELLVSRLFTEYLRTNEALMMIGCERYSNYSGYAQTFHWTGDYIDQTPFDSSQRRRVAILAIDALAYPNAKHEYRKDNMHREITKAWVGFSFFADEPTSLNYPGVATGNWGCGAFGGTPQLKSLIQMMACAEAKRPMAYYTFKDYKIRDDVINIYLLLARNNITVGKLFMYLMQFTKCDVVTTDLHAFIRQKLKEREAKRKLQAPSELMMELSVSSEPSKPTTPKNSDEFSFSFSQAEIVGSLDQCTEDMPHENFEASSAQTSTETNTKYAKLFDEMRKLEGQSGSTNLSIFNIPSKSTNVGSEAMDSSSIQPETKKKRNKKITDYFSKK